MGKIGIFPASGNLGTSIYTHLLNHVDASNVVLVSRYPEKLPSAYAEAGVLTRKADFEDAGTLQGAFDDVSHLLVISKSTIEIDSRVKVRMVLLS